MTVVWEENTLDRLADILVRVGSVAEQDRVEATVQRVNTCLARDPEEYGESRGGDDRVWFVDQLMVVFRVVTNQDEVRILRVVHLGLRRMGGS